ncbi:hypothetical protein L6452_17416 [Arctium lappa]|uniref:Uncharacterized protein n=1 Tax=Arctium lappa TaxID=4217 RepID=A0ACB9C3A9_ARCLA|nr:hypothetical protein L6452_17416 [Arctium lappa]
MQENDTIQAKYCRTMARILKPPSGPKARISVNTNSGHRSTAADDVDYGLEEERAPDPTVDRSDWPELATDLNSRVTGLEYFVRDELTDLRRLIINGPSAEDIGVGPSRRPPSRRVWGHRSGSSSSFAHQNRDN